LDRFAQLEFDSQDGSRKVRTQGEPIRDAFYFHQKAIKYWLGGDFELALKDYSRALEQNQAFFEGWAGQVWMLLELEEYPEAMLWADKALELFPEHPEIFAAKAVACLRDAKYEKAQAFSDNAISKDNTTSRVWLARAEVLLARKSKMFESCINNAISISNQDRSIIRLESGRILFKGEEYTLALSHLSRAAKELSQSALAWYELGRCQARLGLPESVEVLRQSLKLRPNWRLAEEALVKAEKRGFFRRIFGKRTGH